MNRVMSRIKSASLLANKLQLQEIQSFVHQSLMQKIISRSIKTRSTFQMITTALLPSIVFKKVTIV